MVCALRLRMHTRAPGMSPCRRVLWAFECVALTRVPRHTLAEENAVICLRIIFDLHKNFRPTLECEVQPFLDFVQRIYQGLPKTVELVFHSRAAAQAMLLQMLRQKLPRRICRSS